VDKLHPAQVGSSGKTGHVTDHAATNRNHQRFAIGAGAAKRPRNVFYIAEILGGFGVIE
jgi:hypothetical protein